MHLLNLFIKPAEEAAVSLAAFGSLIRRGLTINSADDDNEVFPNPPKGNVDNLEF